MKPRQVGGACRESEGQTTLEQQRQKTDERPCQMTSGKENQIIRKQEVGKNSEEGREVEVRS